MSGPASRRKSILWRRQVLPSDPGVSSWPVQMTVNGVEQRVTLDTRTTLLDMLREHIGFTGTKKGCDHGQCGACTVLVDGRRINSCLTLAVLHDGDDDHDDRGPRARRAIASDASRVRAPRQLPVRLLHARPDLLGGRHASRAQGGRPSLVTEDLTSHPDLTDGEIRERMSGNICRCSAYPNIVAAIRDAAGETI